ncbi:Pro-Pol polyprotein [Trachymyrmex zeteki]|uniref:Pro-Pol polyprotein n=1 Tax=Mycetomoellerius zeteki TaxID=64791 RepID=A0A151XI02_9HYME|nr:Pro-Pol polyprotein [Trachymyrmex zeteki]
MDQGSQFEATLFDALVKLVGTKRIRTTAYHPQSNGLVKRWHRSLKAAIMCQDNTEWTEVLPVVLLSPRSCYKEDIHASTAELFYGRTLRIPSEFFDHEDVPNDPQLFIEPFRKFIQRIRPIPTAHHICNKPFRYKDLHTCTHIFLRDDTVKRPLECPYSRPHRIIERISDRVFTIEVEGRRINVSTERLKPAYFIAPQEEHTNTSSRSTTEPGTTSATDDQSNLNNTRLILKTYPIKK